MGYTVVEHDLLDRANAALSDAAFRILILLLRETKATMRWGNLPDKVADDDMPIIRLGLKRLGWKTNRKIYYRAVAELESAGFITAFRTRGAALQVRLAPSAWKHNDIATMSYQCPGGTGEKKNQYHGGTGKDDDQCPTGTGKDANQCPNGTGKDANQCPNGTGFAPIQYKDNTTPNTTPKQVEAMSHTPSTNSGEGMFEKKKKENLPGLSDPEPDEALPLLEVLHRRYCNSAMPEHWRTIGEGAFLPPASKTSGEQECSPSAFLESVEAFDTWLDALDKSWRREREALTGSLLKQREYEVSALASVAGDMHDCWHYAERLKDTLFLEYHRIGRHHALADKAGCETHLRELAVMLCRRLGLEPSTPTLGRFASLMQRHGRLAVVDQAEALRYPGDRNGIRDVFAVIAHRLDKAAEVSLTG
jgi:hypothetical protein